MRPGLKHVIIFSVTIVTILMAMTQARAESTIEPALQEPISEVFSLSLSRPLGMAYDGSNLWVIDRETAELCALDMRSGQVLRRLDAPGPWPVGLAWDGQLLWVTDPTEERIFAVDLARGLMVRALPSPTATPQGLTWDGEALWLSDGRQLLRV